MFHLYVCLFRPFAVCWPQTTTVPARLLKHSEKHHAEINTLQREWHSAHLVTCKTDLQLHHSKALHWIHDLPWVDTDCIVSAPDEFCPQSGQLCPPMMAAINKPLWVTQLSSLPWPYSPLPPSHVDRQPLVSREWADGQNISMELHAWSHHNCNSYLNITCSVVRNTTEYVLILIF